MLISENFKKKCKQLEKIGFTHVSSVASSKFRTTYRHYLSMTEIIDAKVGENKSFGRYNGVTSKSFHATSGVNAIAYQDVFNFFK